MSLGFTAEQVWKDFVEEERSIENWVKILERRNELKMLKDFRAFGVTSGLLPDRRYANPGEAA